MQIVEHVLAAAAGWSWIAVVLMLAACAPTGTAAEMQETSAVGQANVRALPPPTATSLAPLGPVPTVAPAPGERVFPGSAVRADVRVRVFDDDFEPRRVLVEKGQTVEWFHAGLRRHTVSAGDGSWGSGNFDEGDLFLMRFDTGGSYDFLCQLHVGMRGIVVVQG